MLSGSASDVIKYAMLSVERKIDQHPLFGYPSSVAHQQLSIRVQRNPLRPSIISQIHDEVIYDLARHTKYTGMQYKSVAKALSLTMQKIFYRAVFIPLLFVI
jgi:DNA polymerase I-like protein with 3'-5' exonuclease and polymerase domains